MKKRRNFKDCSEALGIKHHHVPKFVDVRFRYVVKLALYMEENDRGLYEFYKEVKEKRDKGQTISDTEACIVETFIEDYVNIRLTNKFILAVFNDYIDTIDFFESREVRIHHQFNKLIVIFADNFSNFLKKGGMDKEGDVSVEKLLKIDYRDKGKTLPRTEIFVGSNVEEFIEELGLTKDSKCLNPFYDSHQML